VKYLKGMQKPIYHPMSKLILNPIDDVMKKLNIFLLDDSGDHVVCINTKKIALPGDEWTKRGTYKHYLLPSKLTSSYIFWNFLF